MEAYLKITHELSGQFDKFELTRIPRGENSSADALAALASTLDSLVKRIIPAEGIEKPNINIAPKAVVNAVTRAQRARESGSNLDTQTSTNQPLPDDMEYEVELSDSTQDEPDPDSPTNSQEAEQDARLTNSLKPQIGELQS